MVGIFPTHFLLLFYPLHSFVINFILGLINMNQFILALCGLPASGKSTLADAIQTALNYKVEIVRTDEWRDNAYYTNWKSEKEKPVRQKALARVKELVSEGKSVIHDDTTIVKARPA